MAKLSFEPFQGVELRGVLADGTEIVFPNVEIEITAHARPQSIDDAFDPVFTFNSSERVHLHVKPTNGGILFRVIQAQEEITLEELYDGNY